MIKTKNIFIKNNSCIICTKEYGIINLWKNYKYKYCKTC